MTAAKSKPRSATERVQSEAVARKCIEDGGTWTDAAAAVAEFGLPPTTVSVVRHWARENGWYKERDKHYDQARIQALRDSRTPGHPTYIKRLEELNGWTPEQRAEAAKEVGEAGLEMMRQAVILAHRVGEVSQLESWDGKINQLKTISGADVESVMKSAALALEKADRLGGIPSEIAGQLGGLAGQIGSAIGFSALDRILQGSKDMVQLYDGSLPATAIEAPKAEPEFANQAVEAAPGTATA